MRIGKYNIRADNHQFILEEAKINSTEKDGVKGKNYGEEQLINPSYHSWDGLVNKLIKLELMASVDGFDSSQDVIRNFESAMLHLSDAVTEQIRVGAKMYNKLGELVWFLENMHECDTDWTIKESSNLHKEVNQLLAEARGEKTDTA